MLKYLLAGIQWMMKKILKIPVLGYYFDLIFLACNSILPTGAGVFVAKGIEKCNRPKKMLILYEFEACPFCRKVRETLTALDLDVLVYPCPRETLASYGYVKDSRYRTEVLKLGGKAQFPLLIDENEMVDGKPMQMYDSGKIVEYLWEKYGNEATKPLSYRMGSNSKLGFIITLVLVVYRALPEHGMLRMPSKMPEKPLELYSFESSPFAKKVREVLCCLELPHVVRHIGKGSSKREAFKEQYGKYISSTRNSVGMIIVPMLVDPNTGVTMIESEDIKQYLLKTYKAGECASSSILEYTQKGKSD